MPMPSLMPKMQQVMDASAIFKSFELDEEYGFVTHPNRYKKSLPDAFHNLEVIIADLPALTGSGRLCSLVDKMPSIDVSTILDDRVACEKVYSILSFIAHGYIRGRLRDAPLNRLPESLARPWILLAERIGTVPIVTYCSTVLYNYRLFDESQPLSLENIWTAYSSSGSIDEAWFYLISLAIESKSGNLIKIFIALINAVESKDFLILDSLLQKVAESISELQSILVRMYEECIPAVFYQRVRRYLSGWLNDDQLPNGLIYGDEETLPRKYAGGSAAQSPLIQCLDIILGVRHAKRQDLEDTGVGSAGNYLVEMRRYMSKNHRDFLCWLEDHLHLHDIVSRPNVPSKVVEAYNNCVVRLKSFRDKHLAIVSSYVVVQAAKMEASTSSVKGTGGSNPIPFLKEIRSHMDNVYIKKDKK